MKHLFNKLFRPHLPDPRASADDEHIYDNQKIGINSVGKGFLSYSGEVRYPLKYWEFSTGNKRFPDKPTTVTEYHLIRTEYDIKE